MICILILIRVFRDQDHVGGPGVLGASGTTILKKIPSIPHFQVLGEKDTVWFEEWLQAISNVQKNFNEQCVGDAADVICCLPPKATLKILNGYIYRILWEEFYRIVEGKNGKVQTFVLHLERTLRVIIMLLAMRFSFQNKFYEQVEGVAMGSPVSPIVAKQVLRKSED